MNPRVKIPKIFAAMPNQRARERRPGFFGHFDGAGNEELVVRNHRQRSMLNPQHSTSKADGWCPPRPACGERIAAYKFRRHPFNSYVLDFYCQSAKLAIELDGEGHNYRAGQVHDQTRSEFLASHGVIVLRFWNHQVRQELDSVLRAIWFAVEERQKNNSSPSSSPFVKGRGDA